METREIEVAKTGDGEDTLMDGDETHATEKQEEDGKLLVFEPAIVVKLDEWEARIGLLDLVYIPASSNPNMPCDSNFLTILWFCSR